MKHPTRIAFDLDGTLCEHPTGFVMGTSSDDDILELYKTREPIEQTIKFCNAAKQKGYYVYIYTARDERWRTVTEHWLEKFGVNYDALVMNKLHVLYYIGDEAYNVEQLNELELKILGDKNE